MGYIVATDGWIGSCGLLRGLSKAWRVARKNRIPLDPKCAGMNAARPQDG
jgi:hypothetical protein